MPVPAGPAAAPDRPPPSGPRGAAPPGARARSRPWSAAAELAVVDRLDVIAPCAQAGDLIVEAEPPRRIDRVLEMPPRIVVIVLGVARLVHPVVGLLGECDVPRDLRVRGGRERR